MTVEGLSIQQWPPPSGSKLSLASRFIANDTEFTDAQRFTDNYRSKYGR